MGICCLAALCRRKSLDINKLKTLLGLTVSRLALLRSQRQIRCAQHEADVAQLLLLRHRDRALLRVEMVIKERDMLDVFAMVESYCHLLTERAFLFNNQMECPEELREAAAGLVFAASRCGDLPELREIRRIFTSRFGKEFTTAAADLRNNCGVNGRMVQKFSTRQPSLEIRAKVAREIATAKGIKLEVAEPPVETVEYPNLPRKQQQTRVGLDLPCTVCDLHELLGLELMALKKYMAATSAAAELYRLELERIRHHYNNAGKQKPENCLCPSTSCCSSTDLGCRSRKLSSLLHDLEIQSESDDTSDRRNKYVILHFLCNITFEKNI